MTAATNGHAPNGVHQNVDSQPQTNGDVPSTNPYTIPLNEEYAFTPRKLKVVTIGAGFSVRSDISLNDT